jgi:integrase/recombinase XerD
VLTGDVDRYIALRRTLGYKLRNPARHLQTFANYATSRGEAHIRTATVLAWVSAAGPTLEARADRFRSLALFARFLHAEDPRHEVLPRNPFPVRKTRPVPYIYTPDEIARILDAAGKLRRQQPNPLRRELYITMFGLIRRNRSAHLRGDRASRRRRVVRWDAAHPRDQVLQEPACAASSDRR